MINQKESKKIRTDSWLFKLLSRDVKTKTKKQKSTNKKSYKNRKIKAMRNLTPTVNHYPRNG